MKEEIRTVRILHTSVFYHPERVGGAQEVVRQISERLARRGHDVSVATSYSPERKLHLYNGVRIEHFRVQGFLNHSALGILGTKKDFLRYLRQSDFDIVMNYAAQTWCSDLTYQVLSELHSKTILAPCGYSGLIGWRRLPYARYFQQLPYYLRQYDCLVYHSPQYRDKQFGDAAGVKNFRIIPNGIDSDEFESDPLDFRTHYGIRTKYLLLSVGNHFINKGHNRVISAFDQLERDDATLVIVGGNTAPRFRSCWQDCLHAARKRNGRILLLSEAPRSHVVAAHQAADLFLSGSHIEVFPLVIVEAMASKTPFVSFPAGNIEDLPGGIVVRSITEMAKQISRLLDDGPRREELGTIGRLEQRTRYEWNSIVDQYESLYLELLGR